MGELSSPIEMEYHDKTGMKRPKFREETREFFLRVIRDDLCKPVEEGGQGAQCVVLGCTEIELLIKQEDCPDIPVIPSAEEHIEACCDVLLGNENVGSLVPLSLRE